STACCSGISTWCRNGPTASSAPRVGTVLVTPRRCRNTVRRHFPQSGGGMRRGRPKCHNGHSSMTLSRRRALGLFVSAAAAGAGGRIIPAAAQDVDRHGMSAFGDLKYPPDFPHFSYVNPNAPKGGVFSQIGPSRQFNQSFQTFNSLNSYILKG